MTVDVPRLRRAEAVLSARTGRLLLVLERIVDTRNAHAVMRTAEAFGVQNVWMVRAGYKKNNTIEEKAEEFQGSVGGGHGDELGQAITPADVKSQLHKHVKVLNGVERGPVPIYRTANIAGRGSSDIWVSTVALPDGRSFKGGHCRSRREAERTAALAALRGCGVEVELPEHAPMAEVRPAASTDLPKSQAVTRGAERWLSVREFNTTEACVSALREDGWQIWSTDLSPEAVELSNAAMRQEMPERVAIVIGNETTGVSPEMLSACDRRVYLPMHGFTESFNLSVATALVLQRLFDGLGAGARGTLPADVAAELRESWIESLGGNPTARAKLAEASAGEVEPLADLRRAADGKERRMRPKVVRKEKERQSAIASPSRTAADTPSVSASSLSSLFAPAAYVALGTILGASAAVALRPRH